MESSAARHSRANVGLIISAKPRVNPPTRNIKISRKKSATDQ